MDAKFKGNFIRDQRMGIGLSDSTYVFWRDYRAELRSTFRKSLIKSVYCRGTLLDTLFEAKIIVLEVHHDLIPSYEPLKFHEQIEVLFIV